MLVSTLLRSFIRSFAYLSSFWAAKIELRTTGVLLVVSSWAKAATARVRARVRARATSDCEGGMLMCPMSLVLYRRELVCFNSLSSLSSAVAALLLCALTYSLTQPVFVVVVAVVVVVVLGARAAFCFS